MAYAGLDNNACKAVIVMPAYNAEKTLEKTYADIAKTGVEKIILSDDASADNTVSLAQSLGIEVITNAINQGYGANQKRCYDAALKYDAEYIIMIHPDYQYDAKVIPYALGFLEIGICDIVIGSRIRTRHEALKGGMPLYKYLSNRVLTIIENFVLGQNLGDFHSGFRIFRREILKKIPYHNNSDCFVFDTEILFQSAYFGFRIGDVPIPTRYFPEASSINFYKSIIYGIKTCLVMLKYCMQKTGIFRFSIFEEKSF